MTQACWKCGKELVDLPKKISIRELCPFCDAYLHCCKNCVNYQAGLANDCKIPGTDPISDREGRNSCEEFVSLGKAPPPKGSSDLFSSLFK